MVEAIYWDFVTNLDSMILSKGIYNHPKIREFFVKNNCTNRRQILELIRYSRNVDSILEKLVKKIYRNSKRNSGTMVNFTDSDIIEFPCHLLKLGKKEFEDLIKNPELLNNYQDPKYWINNSKKIVRPKTFDLSPTLAFITYINSLSK